ncbi:MAG: L-seryl-tRNA(Sec) selenium transferase [bacterium]|nr:L-seryl-tRNA(Sec) selenium transferase [bacterium]
MKPPENAETPAALLRHLPSVDEVMARLREDGAKDTPGALLAEAARRAIETARRRILAGEGEKNGAPAEDTLLDDIAEEAKTHLLADRRMHLRPVINATGVILHTNLGRAPLAPAAVRAVAAVSESYSTLEYDVAEGRRGKRAEAIEELLCRLTGAEAALVVNNNAAAVMFALRFMAEGREVIISRGELVEIGGSFRIPDIMRQSGARLVEVGATNKTRIEDFEEAIGSETGLLLKAHTSNYRIVGFTEEVPRDRLAALAREKGIPFLEDLGSGLLIPVPGLPAEPTVGESVAAGIDVITFSGDKLLGGPQAGLVVGKAEWVDRMKRHPLMRALRLDKMTLAALEATLRLYLDPETALREIPVLRMLSEPAEAGARRADALLAALGEEAAAHLRPEKVDTICRVGGGAMPTAEIKSCALALSPAGLSTEAAEHRLRNGAPTVIGRIQEDRLLLEMRSVRDAEIEPLAQALRNLAASITAA